MNKQPKELPEELKAQIGQEAEAYAEKNGDCIREIVTEYRTHDDLRGAYIAGATEYAQKYQQAMKLWEDCFKYALKQSRAFTDSDIEERWLAVKSNNNL